ncbi:hypothetical protein ACFWVC_00430 [Streptomyces sp. NPDC058691]|uniref:hypothetical protein n=1 Tax=Streptomyces sp. NPDC058691 TaxID=3346601 RepID=UPI00365885FD
MSGSSILSILNLTAGTACLVLAVCVFLMGETWRSPLRWIAIVTAVIYNPTHAYVLEHGGKAALLAYKGVHLALLSITFLVARWYGKRIRPEALKLLLKR